MALILNYDNKYHSHCVVFNADASRLEKVILLSTEESQVLDLHELAAGNRHVQCTICEFSWDESFLGYGSIIQYYAGTLSGCLE